MPDLPDPAGVGGEASSSSIESISIGYVHLNHLVSTSPDHADNLLRLAVALYEEDGVGIPGIDGFLTPSRAEGFIEDQATTGNLLYGIEYAGMICGYVNLVRVNDAPDQIVLRVLDGYERYCMREALRGALWVVFDKLGKPVVDLFALKEAEVAVARDFGMKMLRYDRERGYEHRRLRAEEYRQRGWATS